MSDFSNNSKIGKIIVRCENITKYYPVPLPIKSIFKFQFTREKKLILDNIGFSVREGEIFGIIGPNGAGKTTTVKIMCTLTTPTKGKGFVYGHDVAKERREVLKKIGYCISEERSFFWRLTGRQNLNFFAELLEVPPEKAKRRINELLERFELEDSSDKRFLNYSSGMKQKMAIARSLLADPEVIFMDEPTRGLDPGSAFKLRSLIKSFAKEENKTIIITTNRVSDIKNLCQRILVLNKGKAVIKGTLEEISSSVKKEHGVSGELPFEEIFNLLLANNKVGTNGEIKK